MSQTKVVSGPLRRVTVVKHGEHEGQEGRKGQRGGSQPGFAHTGAESGNGREGGGQDRFIVAEDDRRKAVIRVHRRDFEKMDPVLRQRLSDDGVTWVVSAKPMSGMVSRIAGKTPRGWDEGDTWDDVSGGYATVTQTVYAGKNGDASSSVVIHETGHAFDDVLGSVSEFNDEFHDIHVRLSESNGLGYYFNQDGAGGRIGKQELFAEAFSLFHTDRNSITVSWGADLDIFMEETIKDYIDHG